MTYMLACLKQQIKKYLAMTADDLKEIFPELSFVSEISVQRHLLMTLKPAQPVCCPEAFAHPEDEEEEAGILWRAYKNWTEEDCLFSNESMVRCIQSIKSKVRRPSGSNRFDSRYMSKTVKPPDSVMIFKERER